LRNRARNTDKRINKTDAHQVENLTILPSKTHKKTSHKMTGLVRKKLTAYFSAVSTGSVFGMNSL